jgi:hypothetical protein
VLPGYVLAGSCPQAESLMLLLGVSVAFGGLLSHMGPQMSTKKDQR